MDAFLKPTLTLFVFPEECGLAREGREAEGDGGGQRAARCQAVWEHAPAPARPPAGEAGAGRAPWPSRNAGDAAGAASVCSRRSRS